MIAVRFASVKQTQPAALASSWSELIAVLSEHEANAVKTTRALWSPVSYCPGTTRKIVNVDQVFAFVTDLDGHDLSAMMPMLDGLAFIAYTTHSHSASEPSWHVVVPLAEPIDAEAWPAAWPVLNQRLGGLDDASTCDSSRAYFMPQHAPGAVFDVVIGKGEPLTMPAVSSVQPVRRVAGKRAEPRRAANFIPDEAWWSEPADLSRFDGMTERQTIEALCAELRVITAAILADIEADEKRPN